MHTFGRCRGPQQGDTAPHTAKSQLHASREERVTLSPESRMCRRITKTRQLRRGSHDSVDPAAFLLSSGPKRISDLEFAQSVMTQMTCERQWDGSDAQVVWRKYFQDFLRW